MPISEPKPVPLASNVRRAIRPATSLPQKSGGFVRDEKISGYIQSNVPRSQPISMKRSDQRNCNDSSNNTAATAPSAINISSISPPVNN